MNRNRNRAMEITVIMVHNDDNGCSRGSTYPCEPFFKAAEELLMVSSAHVIREFGLLMQDAADIRDAEHIVDLLDELEGIDDGKSAVELMHSMLYAAGSGCGAKAAECILMLGGILPDAYESFMEMFFDDEYISGLLTANWLPEDDFEGTCGNTEEARVKEESHGEM